MWYHLRKSRKQLHVLISFRIRHCQVSPILQVLSTICGGYLEIENSSEIELTKIIIRAHVISHFTTSPSKGQLFKEGSVLAGSLWLLLVLNRKNTLNNTLLYAVYVFESWMQYLVKWPSRYFLRTKTSGSLRLINRLISPGIMVNATEIDFNRVLRIFDAPSQQHVVQHYHDSVCSSSFKTSESNLVKEGFFGFTIYVNSYEVFVGFPYFIPS